MGFLKRLEFSLEEWFEGWIGKRFKGPLQPQEVARKIIKVMLKNKKISINKVYVPNRYDILMSPVDWEHFKPIAQSFSREISEVLAAEAQDRNFTLAGSIQVHLDVDDSLAQGRLTIATQFQETEEIAAVNFSARKIDLGDTIKYGKLDVEKTYVGAGLLLRVVGGPDEGKTYKLGRTKTGMGRWSENEIMLNDSNISRQHAEIKYYNGAYYLCDLNSTNGTYLNGEKVRQEIIAPGDKIVLGRTELQVEEG